MSYCKQISHVGVHTDYSIFTELRQSLPTSYHTAYPTAFLFVQHVIHGHELSENTH